MAQDDVWQGKPEPARSLYIPRQEPVGGVWTDVIAKDEIALVVRNNSSNLLLFPPDKPKPFIPRPWSFNV